MFSLSGNGSISKYWSLKRGITSNGGRPYLIGCGGLFIVDKLL